MIHSRFKAGTEYRGHKIRFTTELFGKAYFWMEDVDGTTYLAKIGEDGLPSLS